MSRCSPYPPAALPSSLSMASSATEPNRDTAAPYEPDGGVRRPGSRALRLVPFFGLPKRRPSEYCETGGALALNGRCSIVRSNNQPNDGFGGGGGIGEAMRTGGTCVGGRLPIVSGGEWSDEKKENGEGDGASDCDGSCCMARRNNQPKVGRIVGVYLWEAARRAETIGENAVTPFWPSDFGAKKEYIKIRCCLRRPPIDNCTQQPTKLSRARWWTNRRGRTTVGERRGGRIRSF